MMFPHVKGLRPRGKAAIVFLILCLAACTRKDSKQPEEIRVLSNQNIITLNPRVSVDAIGQRLGSLMFRGLTRLDADLKPIPDLAETWQVLEKGKTWKFKLRAGSIDHGGQPITAEKLAQCLENYRIGKPTSPIGKNFANWIGTRAEGDSLIVSLSSPDPYFDRNALLLRYFRVDGSPTPCEEPKPGQSVITSGWYKPEKWENVPEGDLVLNPVGSGTRLRFLFVMDENTKALKILRGEVDVAPNAISLSKTRWIQKSYSDRFDVLERPGVTASYLAFNFRDPILSRKEVRRAIAYAIDRESFVQGKMMGFGTVAGSFLSPLLPESYQVPIPHDPSASEMLLDQAGFPRGKDGMRLKLHFKCTPAREGIENAYIFQDMLKKVGIDLVVDVVEQAVFFASIRNGNFQLYSSRWIGVSDGSILFRSLHSKQSGNRVGYKNPEMDQLLEASIADPNPERRKSLLKEAQIKMAEEMPYFPLWYWANSTVIRKGITGLRPEQLSLSGAFEPLTLLHR